ncbi:hypothetical protein BOX15_Mlig002565g1 [Macrostomum lignano]|uniref:Uncharacterized protein n=1 Tax=Macrostomum lignano TaxID=282301 RepID=A0A267EMV2_9PLAT|nr:hypothetical protein BOX15_Mlig002565g1 [Macrostomum lignano]
MTEVISEKYVLSDSMAKTRPGTEVFYRTDANAGLNDIRRFQQERFRRIHRFPPYRGSADAKSFGKESSPEFKKFEDSGLQRCAAPYRDYESIVDPISGSIGAGAAFVRGLPGRPIGVYAHNDGPQYNRPQTIHSIRKGMPGAYPEIDRASETEPPGLPAHQKLVGPGYTRAVQGGWTSGTDQTPESAKLTLLCHLPKARPDMSERDRLAYKYIYTSTTQSAYEAVPAEDMPRGGYKRFPPTHTLEAHADPVSLTNNSKKTLPPAQTWCSQERGLTWDFKQLRPDYYNRQRPYTYCSVARRTDHLPTYSGCVGADNPQEIDNPYEPLRPYTVLRNPQPKFGVSGAPTDIPGYTGRRAAVQSSVGPRTSQQQQQQSVSSVAHPAMPARLASTSSTCHGRFGNLSSVVTTVEPKNPFGGAATRTTSPPQ